MATLNELQEEWCRQNQWTFTDLRALFINCTLKRSPDVSNTQALVDASAEIMVRHGVATETIRLVDHANGLLVSPGRCRGVRRPR